MSTDKIENKDKAEQKVSKDELSEKELQKATGGGISYNSIQFEYTKQKEDGTN